ncbi:MAG: ATP-binding protein [Woeseiaceae bacterium]|nr:ATP-binding protein [Woeseiaceae bacterium]
MNAARDRYAQVLRYVYALTAVVVIAAAALIIAVYTAQKADDEARDRVTFYYLASSAASEQLYRNTQSLQRLLTDAAGGTPETTGRPIQPGVSGTLYSMRSQLERLLELQAQYMGQQFDATLSRLEVRFTTIEWMAMDSAPPGELLDSVAALELNIDQLHRLHEIAAAETLGDIESQARLILPNLALLTAILLAAIVGGWFVTRLLRQALERQAQTEEALAASQERMHHMQKLEALGQLVGGVAHDFNNLLTAILGQAGLLRDHASADSELQDGLGEISEAARQATSLTNQLLAFSRRQPIQAQAFDLNELIRSMQPMLRRLISEDIEINYELGKGLGAVELDTGQMHQVVLNLVINAKDAMPDGGSIDVVTEWARLETGDPQHPAMTGGDYTRLIVADSGTGMDEETRERAFEPFFTTKPRGRGTGLGLATVHGIISAAGGEISIDSRPGGGTRIRILLPVSTRSAEAAAAEHVATGTRAGSETVLVVEDEAQIRTFLRNGLGSLGYTVLTAPGGKDGLDICERETGGIDVIVSDIVMPNMNGAEFMKAALNRQPSAVGIYISGYTDDVALQHGMDESIPLLYKPFELDDIAALIRERLDGASG